MLSVQERSLSKVLVLSSAVSFQCFYITLTALYCVIYREIAVHLRFPLISFLEFDTNSAASVVTVTMVFYLIVALELPADTLSAVTVSIEIWVSSMK